MASGRATVRITSGRPPSISWQNPNPLDPKRYTCGHCDTLVGPNLGYYATVSVDGQSIEPLVVMICSNCKLPTSFDLNGKQHPGVPFGNAVDSLPPNVEALYDEARRAYSVGAYTASVLACRKILMNVAVAQGADEGKSFISYVEHLAAAGYVPPDGKGWVDHIRKKGNEATHEIALMTAQDATELISFAEMLLKFVYEFPARVPT